MVPVRELRDIFNALEIARKGRAGFLLRRRLWTGSRRPEHLHTGSRSVLWAYYMPNGWLGGNSPCLFGPGRGSYRGSGPQADTD